MENDRATEDRSTENRGAEGESDRAQTDRTTEGRTRRTVGWVDGEARIAPLRGGIRPDQQHGRPARAPATRFFFLLRGVGDHPRRYEA